MRWMLQGEEKFLQYPQNRKVSCRSGHERQDRVKRTPLFVQWRAQERLETRRVMAV